MWPLCSPTQPSPVSSPCLPSTWITLPPALQPVVISFLWAALAVRTEARLTFARGEGLHSGHVQRKDRNFGTFGGFSAATLRDGVPSQSAPSSAFLISESVTLPLGLSLRAFFLRSPFSSMSRFVDQQNGSPPPTPHAHFAAASYPPPLQVREPPSTVTPGLVYLN